MEKKEINERRPSSQKTQKTQPVLTDEMKKKLKQEGEILFDFLDYLLTGKA